MIITYKISCPADFDTFCKKESNLRWSSGLPLSDSFMRNTIISHKFPIYCEIDDQGYVLLLNSKPKNAIVYPTEEEPISFMVDQKKTRRLPRK